MEEDITKTISTRDFISTVENESAVWNVETTEYRNKIAKRNAWNRIITKYVPDFLERNDAEQLNIITQFRRKWKGLRSCYSRELLRKKEERNLVSKTISRKEYSFFKNLSFLQSISKQSPNIDDIVEDNESIDMDIITSLTPSKINIKTETKSVNQDNESLQPVLQRLTEYTNTQDSPDKLFMLSLVPELEKLPEEVKLDVKADLLNVFKKARQCIAIKNQ